MKKTILSSLILTGILTSFQVQSEAASVATAKNVPSQPAAAQPAQTYNVREFGATGDAVTLDTVAIQKALDLCSAKGGGTVLIPAGQYLIGTLYLRSNVNLRIEPEATLLGSPNISDYATDTHRNMYRGESHMDRCLIFARNAENFSIEGGGTIDGQGKYFAPQKGMPVNRPMLIRFLECSGIRLKNVRLESPAAWTSAWLYCSNIEVSDLNIHSRALGNGDGLDFDGCQNVRVNKCNFDTSDDSICLQTSRPDRPCRDIVVTDCTFKSKWAGMRIGLLSRGDFEKVRVSNCRFLDISDSGLKIQLCEGGEMRDMIFSNLEMKNVPRPIFMTFCQQRACVDAPMEWPSMKRMRDLSFENITVNNEAAAVGKQAAFILTGLPGHAIENIRLTNINATFAGGGTAEDAAGKLKELTRETIGSGWPEYRSFKATVPAHGLYARHVQGLILRNLHLKTAQPDARPSMVLEDVEGLDSDQ